MSIEEGFMHIDARGLGCPKPVMVADEALAKISEGTIEILVDNEASAKNLERFSKKNGFHSETFREDNLWRVKIVKGHVCEVPSADEKSLKTEKSLLIIVGSDTMGKEEELGRILMKGVFETMKMTKELPHTIFFLNTGIRLTTLDDEFISLMKEFNEMGVEIFTCGTCLKYFNLESELKVGFRGTTNHIVEGITEFKKTVWIG
jgi:selenium metabolism protein YedF